MRVLQAFGFNVVYVFWAFVVELLFFMCYTLITTIYFLNKTITRGPYYGSSMHLTFSNSLVIGKVCCGDIRDAFTIVPSLKGGTF